MPVEVRRSTPVAGSRGPAIPLPAPRPHGSSPSIGASLVLSIVLLIGLVAAAGCGPEGPETVRVYGRIVFDGNPPESVGAVGGTVIYSPVDIPDGLPKRPAVGNFEKDGKFEVSSYGQGDGIVPGTYGVRIDCWTKRPEGFIHPGISAMPPGYSPPQLVVRRSSDVVEVVYDVRTK